MKNNQVHRRISCVFWWQSQVAFLHWEVGLCVVVVQLLSHVQLCDPMDWITAGSPVLYYLLGSPGGSDGKESICNVGDPGLIPGSGRSPGEGHGNPLQYSCLENPMDRGARWATVIGVAKSWTWLSTNTDGVCSNSCPVESVMPSKHLILCHSLLLLPSIFPSIAVFSSESALCIKWSKYWTFSFILSEWPVKWD